jgi:hypothetical protein
MTPMTAMTAHQHVAIRARVCARYGRARVATYPEAVMAVMPVMEGG